jgi:hypothetical protein
MAATLVFFYSGNMRLGLHPATETEHARAAFSFLE